MDDAKMTAVELAELFRRDIKRLGQQIAAFPDDETLWRTAGGAANSAGNLALHLEGNSRDFIGRQLGNVAYLRVREKEFSTKNVTREELLSRIAELEEMIPNVIATLSTEQLAEQYPMVVLGKPLTAGMFLLHLTGHFNYHLGQIDILRRVITGQTSLPLAGL